MTPQANIAWANVVGFCFPLGAMVAIDMSAYPSDFSPLADSKNRRIILHLSHGVSYTFKNEQADDFYKWWLELSTPKEVIGVKGIIRPA